MKKLLDAYEFETTEQYYEMVQDSYINGQKKQAKEQFLAMPKDNRREFVFHLGIAESDLFRFFLNFL